MNFLVFEAKDQAAPARPMPAGYSVETWRPGLFRIMPPTMTPKFALWWLFHYCRVFHNRHYSVLLVRHQGAVVHRTCVIPPYFRWPFMTGEDLQVSSTWTDPGHRNRGLATCALQHVIANWAQHGRTIWYVTHPENLPSLAVCNNVGFRLLSQASRTWRFGLRLFGQLIPTDKP